MHRLSKELCKCGKPKSQVAKICWECRKKRLRRKCIVCGTEFEFKKSMDKKTCSKECAYKLRGNKSRSTQSRKVILICKLCSKTKLVSPSNQYRKFCSTTCWYKYGLRENSPNWKGGITAERAIFDSSKEWKGIRNLIWKRDNATCQKCKERFNHTQQTFEVHHIKPFEFKEYRLKLDNLILLCRECHIWVHSKRNRIREFIES